MKVTTGSFVLITGAGSGIGRALALAFANKGASVTVVDFGEQNGLETVELVKEEHKKLQLVQDTPAAIFVKCDVTNPADVKVAFDTHMLVYGSLDICINGAGIGERGDVLADTLGSWRGVMEVNLHGVIECSIQAVEKMRKGEKPGVIVNIASAAGLGPTVYPVYSASKAGVILFTRSLAKNLLNEGIRPTVLCPEYVATPLTKEVPKEIIDKTGGFITMDKILEGTFKLIEEAENQDKNCLWISSSKGFINVP